MAITRHISKETTSNDPNTPPPVVETIRLPGLTAYPDGARLQDNRREAVEQGRQPNALFLLEHPPTITLGRNAHDENLLRSRDALAEAGVDVCQANRGGDVTYHGPGQMVAYPILDLRLWQTSIRWYLRTLEQVIIDQLALYGVEAERNEGYTGVWVDGGKIAAVGVALRHWVTFHGLSLNVDPNMTHFSWIIPCGIADKPVVSLKQILGTPPPMVQVQDDFERTF
ncbi:MAG: lipoyl(octanoyl) transferase LipB, partial [Nitrospiraceae bacterium]|nr:lipoyl(octanoyl) transferase LipB [Nitrospiraceae bacterium]